MYIGEEKRGNEELAAAQRDVELKFAGGFPELFYRKIQFLPVYAAAGNLYKRGLLEVASGKVCGFALLHCFDANYKGCCNDPILPVWLLLLITKQTQEDPAAWWTLQHT